MGSEAEADAWMYPTSFKGYAATDDELIPLLRKNLNYRYRGLSTQLAMELHRALIDLHGPVILCRVRINDSLGHIYTYDHHAVPQPRIPANMARKMEQIFGTKARVFVRSDDPETPYMYNVPSLEGSSTDSVMVIAEEP